MGARPYDPALGRFLAIDSVEGGALNPYDYAFQDPGNAFDLDGRCSLSVLSMLPAKQAMNYLLSNAAAFWGTPVATMVDCLDPIAKQAGWRVKWTSAQGKPAVEFKAGKNRILIETAKPGTSHPSNVPGQPAAKAGQTYMKVEQPKGTVRVVLTTGTDLGGGGSRSVLM